MRTAALVAALSLGVAPVSFGASAAAPADPVDLGGTPVGQVSTDPGNPTELRAGLWSDTLGPGETPDATHQYSYERTGDDTAVHIGVVATAAEVGDHVMVESVIGDTTCDTDSSTPSYAFPEAPFGAAITLTGSDAADRNSTCLTARTVTFTVSRGPSSVGGDLPVAIKIVEEAPLEELDEDLPPSPEEEPGLKLPGTTTPDDVQGGASFADAPLLVPGTHRASGPSGETRLFRVSLDWGQTLAVRLDAAAMGAAELEATGGFVGPQVELSLLDPMRRVLDTHPDGDDSEMLDDVDAIRLSDAAGPVRYLSRWGSSATYLPGEYWVAVSVEASDNPVSVDYELTVAAQGDVEGAPTYSDQDGFTDPFLVGEDSYSTLASGNPAPQDDEAASTTRRLAALGLGLFGLVCCALGALQLRRR